MRIILTFLLITQIVICEAQSGAKDIASRMFGLSKKEIIQLMSKAGYKKYRYDSFTNSLTYPDIKIYDYPSEVVYLFKNDKVKEFKNVIFNNNPQIAKERLTELNKELSSELGNSKYYVGIPKVVPANVNEKYDGKVDLIYEGDINEKVYFWLDTNLSFFLSQNFGNRITLSIEQNN